PRRGCAEVEAYAIGSQAAMAADVVETPVALFRRDLAQDVPELGLERRECLNQRGGVELAGDAGRERVGRIVGKVRFVSLCVQHRGRSSLLLGEHRLAAVKVGLISTLVMSHRVRLANPRKTFSGGRFPLYFY